LKNLLVASIPSPANGVWSLGPLPIRAYAIIIIIGILVAMRVGTKRWVAQGGNVDDVGNIAIYAVPAGVIGGRLYHVLSDNQIYFGPDGKGLVAAFRIWDGGLGIWGAIALGFVGAMYACRKYGIDFPGIADALAPGIVLGQAIGRFGNYFNQELFGRPTNLPWGLQIDYAHRPSGYEEFTTFHPTFLYESLWCTAVAVVLIWSARKFDLKNGQVFALYVALYCLGRIWIESLRIDEANLILGLRLNVLTSLVVGLAAVFWIWRRGKTKSTHKSDI
jgi:prolipoprotein diacylglyceryl transferase